MKYYRVIAQVFNDRPLLQVDLCIADNTFGILYSRYKRLLLRYFMQINLIRLLNFGKIFYLTFLNLIIENKFTLGEPPE